MIPIYLETWSAIALPAEDINHDKAANSIRQAYHFLHLPEHACKFDFCITELGAFHDPELWAICQGLVANCDWFVPFTKVCLIGDRDASYYAQNLP